MSNTTDNAPMPEVLRQTLAEKTYYFRDADGPYIEVVNGNGKVALSISAQGVFELVEKARKLEEALYHTKALCEKLEMKLYRIREVLK